MQHLVAVLPVDDVKITTIHGWELRETKGLWPRLVAFNGSTHDCIEMVAVSPSLSGEELDGIIGGLSALLDMLKAKRACKVQLPTTLKKPDDFFTDPKPSNVLAEVQAAIEQAEELNGGIDDASNNGPGEQDAGEFRPGGPGNGQAEVQEAQAGGQADPPERRQADAVPGVAQGS